MTETKVICEDGNVYSYSTKNVPDSRFTKIISILSGYCRFPVKIECIISETED